MKTKIFIILVAVFVLLAGCSAKKQNDADSLSESQTAETTQVQDDDSAFELEMIPFDFTDLSDGENREVPEETKPASDNTRTTAVVGDPTSKVASTTEKVTTTKAAQTTTTSAATTTKETTAKATTTKAAQTTTTTKAATPSSGTTPTKPTSGSTAPSTTKPGTSTAPSTMPTMPSMPGGAFETPEIPI